LTAGRILDRWEDELEGMNVGKEGGQYVYPEIFVRLLGYVRLLFHLPYRQTEGFLKGLRRFDSRIQVPDYSTIDRRVNKLDVKLDEEDYGDDIVLAVDGSGIKGPAGRSIEQTQSTTGADASFSHACPLTVVTQCQSTVRRPAT